MKLRNKKTGKLIDSVNAQLMIITPSEIPIAYLSINELIENWEDVDNNNATNIPLIKDEKIRKTVRAWAESCSFTIVEHYLSDGFSCFLCTVEGSDYCLDFNLRIDNLEGSKLYYIAELCGEEEE